MSWLHFVLLIGSVIACSALTIGLGFLLRGGIGVNVAILALLAAAALMQVISRRA